MRNPNFSNTQWRVLIIGMALAMMFAGRWIGENLALAVLGALAVTAGWASMTYFSAKPLAGLIIAAVAGVVFYVSGAYETVSKTGASIGGTIQTGLWFGGVVALLIVAYHYAKQNRLIR
jgi:hypothetical protein